MQMSPDGVSTTYDLGTLDEAITTPRVRPVLGVDPNRLISQ